MKIPNPSQEPKLFSKVLDQDLNDMFFPIYSIGESQNLDQWWFKDLWPYYNQIKDSKPQSGTYSFLQILHQNFKDMDVLYTFKINLNSQNSDLGCIKEQWPYSNQDPNIKPESGSLDFIKSEAHKLKSNFIYLTKQSSFI